MKNILNFSEFDLNESSKQTKSRIKKSVKLPDWYDGTLGEVIEKVYKAVHKKYPSIDIDETKFED